MAVTLSKNGKVTLGADEVLEMASWNLTVNDEIVEANVFGNDWKRVAGVVTMSWTASIEGWYDPTDTEQLSLQSEVLSGGLITNLRLYEDATNYWTPDTGTDAAAGCYVTTYTLTVDRSGVNSISLTVEGTGPVHRTS